MTPSCPRCTLDLAKTRSLLGPVPALSPTGVTDFADCLAPDDEKPLQRRMAAFHQQFPQCRLRIVLRECAPQFPTAVHLFWLFNATGDDRTHGRNRDILLSLDPATHHAGLIVGYGLEPFLPQAALEQAVDCASPQFKAGGFASGLLTVLDRLSELMEGICNELPSVLGLDQSLVREPPSRTAY